MRENNVPDLNGAAVMNMESHIIEYGKVNKAQTPQ